MLLLLPAAAGTPARLQPIMVELCCYCQLYCCDLLMRLLGQWLVTGTAKLSAPRLYIRQLLSDLNLQRSSAAHVIDSRYA